MAGRKDLFSTGPGGARSARWPSLLREATTRKKKKLLDSNKGTWKKGGKHGHTMGLGRTTLHGKEGRWKAPWFCGFFCPETRGHVSVPLKTAPLGVSEGDASDVRNTSPDRPGVDRGSMWSPTWSRWTI